MEKMEIHFVYNLSNGNDRKTQRRYYKRFKKTCFSTEHTKYMSHFLFRYLHKYYKPYRGF